MAVFRLAGVRRIHPARGRHRHRLRPHLWRRLGVNRHLPCSLDLIPRQDRSSSVVGSRPLASRGQDPRGREPTDCGAAGLISLPLEILRLRRRSPPPPLGLSNSCRHRRHMSRPRRDLPRAPPALPDYSGLRLWHVTRVRRCASAMGRSEFAAVCIPLWRPDELNAAWADRVGHTLLDWAEVSSVGAQLDGRHP